MESIQKRFVTFKSESLPVVQYYEHQGLCTRLDGSKSVEEVWAATKAFIEKMEPTVTDLIMDIERGAARTAELPPELGSPGMPTLEIAVVEEAR